MLCGPRILFVDGEGFDGAEGGLLSEGEELGEVDDAESFIYRLLNKVQRTRFMYIK